MFLGLELVAEDPHSHEVRSLPPSQNFSLRKQRFQVSVKRVKCRRGARCVKPGKRLSFWFRTHYVAGAEKKSSEQSKGPALRERGFSFAVN